MENNTSVPPLRGPKPQGTKPVAPISKARAAVLERLRAAEGALSVEALAAETGQHSNTVREHLDALVVSGLATRMTAARTGRGRPPWLYAAAMQDTRPVGYVALAAALAGHIAATSDDPAAAGEIAGRQWARVLMGRPAAGPSQAVAAHPPLVTGPEPSGSVQLLARRHVAAELLDAGFGIQVNDDATDFRLTTCPIVAAARENPDVVCAVHLGLVKGLLEGTGIPEGGIKLVPFAGPGVCTLHLPTAQPK